MIENLISSFIDFFTWQSILYLVLGTMLGMVFGILPGLGGAQVLALLLPVSFMLEPGHAIALLMGAAGAVPTGASLTAILMNTPGTSSNAATIFDGFPMAKMGRAGEAIGAAAFASMLGGIFGAIILSLILPFGKYIVLAFSYPENFMMALMGLSMIAILSQGSLWKSLIAACIGLMLSFIGFDPVTGSTRYTFGSMYLWDGIKLVPALIGIFAVAEAISLFTKKGSISQGKVNATFKGTGQGIKAVFKNFGLFSRSSAIGTLIGIIPGVGGTVANFLAYGQAVSTSKNPENFGKGDVRGVIAPESANNAKDGGALVPTLFFGIPGSVEMAVLIGALMIHGIQPGPRLMLDNPDIILILIYSLVFANIIAAILTISLSTSLSRLTSVKSIYIAPIILVLSLVGSYATDGLIQDVIVTLIFGWLGYTMNRYGYSRVGLVIALMLGGLMQTSFHQTLDVFGYAGFFTRPVSLVLVLISLMMFILPALKRSRKGSESQ